MEDITKHYLISGRVQGVGFRAFTAQSAKMLALRGWVRNLDDGRVEAVAQGSPEILDQFEALLKAGPNHGRVDSLRCSQVTDLEVDFPFSVRKDGNQPCCKNS